MSKETRSAQFMTLVVVRLAESTQSDARMRSSANPIRGKLGTEE